MSQPLEITERAVLAAQVQLNAAYEGTTGSCFLGLTHYGGKRRKERTMNFRKMFVILMMCSAMTTVVVAAQSSPIGFVYVMTNNPVGNAVVQYRRAGNGSLTKVSQTPTGGLGGTGNGVGALDPLGSQDSLLLNGTGTMMLAVNAGSNQLSALAASSTGVRLLNTVSSNGSFPNSVALDGNLVYVLNAHGTPKISGFRLGSAGLTPIANSSFDLPGGTTAAPHDIRFSPGGSRLLVTEGGTNHIDVFQLNSNGMVASVNSEPSAGSGPFGMRFGRGGVLANAEANTNSVSSYDLTPSDTLTVTSPAVPNGQQASCWISLTGDGKFAFVSNTASGNLSSYAISGNGTINLEQAIVASANGGNPIDSALSSDSAFLYVDDTSLGRVLIYRVNGSSLKLIGTVDGLPTTLQGIAAQ
jgi:6-phosphogluconolactonase (cycloisomerase 2 family)